MTIGAYDGVHLGHRAIIDAVRELATASGARSAVMTFDRHPASVVRPESAPVGPRPKEVSCLALTFFYDYLKARGHEPSEILHGLD